MRRFIAQFEAVYQIERHFHPFSHGRLIHAKVEWTEGYILVNGRHKKLIVGILKNDADLSADFLSGLPC
jgi:hypothetical protein